VLAAGQCIVISPVCEFVYVCFCVYMWVCCHGNSKLRASIFTKLGLYFVGKDSDHLQLIKFWPSGEAATLGRGSAAGQKCLAPPCYSLPKFDLFKSVCVSLGTFFITIVLTEYQAVTDGQTDFLYQ